MQDEENDMVGGMENLKDLLNQMSQDDSVVKVMLNDMRIKKVAEYDVTHGYTKMDVTADQLQGKFAELKHLVRRGSFTLKGLEDNVYSRWGITEDSRNMAGKPAGTKSQIGFCMSDIKVADISNDSPENR